MRRDIPTYFRRDIIFPCFLWLLFIASSAFGGVEGRLESALLVDNRLNHGVAQFEEWGDFLYRDQSGGIASGLSLAARLSDGEWDSSIYQLYLEKVESSFTIKAGRFERADNSGFYTVDGGSLRRKARMVSVDLYAGVPRRIEDYKSIEGNSLIGLDATFAGETEGKRTFEGRLGYQRFEDENTIQRINWGMSGSILPATYSIGFIAGGSYIPESSMNENLLLEIKGGIEGGGGISVSYELYEPDLNNLSFRDRFYTMYSSGKEEVLKGRLYLRPIENLSLFSEGRKIDHESGVGGYGSTAGASIKKAEGRTLEGEISNLYLDGERAVGLFFSSTTDMTAFTVLKLGGGWQFQQKRTTGENQGLGLEAEVKTMIKGNLFATASAMQIWNSGMDDEYRGMVRLTYTFNETSMNLPVIKTNENQPDHLDPVPGEEMDEVTDSWDMEDMEAADKEYTDTVSANIETTDIEILETETIETLGTVTTETIEDIEE